MPQAPTDPYLSAIRDARLLDEDRLAEISEWAKVNAADPQGLARELTRRGWLTPYQVREVYKGRGADLNLGPYQLLDLIGEGGMGRVFKARHVRLDREVALKVIRKEKLARPGTLDRFRQEIRAAAQLSHPNVILALDAADEAGGTTFFAMEFAEGTDLAKWVRANGPLPVPAACDYVRQAALGLQHAAERGLVHRDVKPSNLLVTPRGQVKVLDLGLAMLMDSSLTSTDTGGSSRSKQGLSPVGTPDFLAPEQVANPGGVDSRADVYSLGGTLFYLLAGRPPFPGPKSVDKMNQHMTEPPPSVLPFRPDVHPQLDAVVRWMMAKRPEERPQSPAQVAAALAPFCPPVPSAVNYATPPGYTAPAVPVAAPYPDPPYGYPTAGPGYPPSGYSSPEPPGSDSTVVFAAEPGSAVASPSRATKRARRPPAGSGAVAKVGLLGVIAFGGLAAAVWIGLQIVPLVKSEPPLEPVFTNSVKMKLVMVPGGTFTMGSPDGEELRDPNEGPAAEVTVSGPFYVSATEVTVGQYGQVMGKVPTGKTTFSKGRNSAVLPVDSVSWADAVEFCKRLTASEPDGRRNWAYRLPTEAEWEYACRAGTATPFCFGPKLVQLKQGVYKLTDNDPYVETDPGRAERDQKNVLVTYWAGSTTPNSLGLHDLHGNVWEWCSDYFDKYPVGPRADPTGPESGDWRVARGGAWDEPAERCRSAARRGIDPNQGYPNVGFRVVYAPIK